MTWQMELAVFFLGTFNCWYFIHTAVRALGRAKMIASFVLAALHGSLAIEGGAAAMQTLGWEGGLGYVWPAGRALALLSMAMVTLLIWRRHE